MINFDDEIKRFQPIPEVNQVEDAIYNNDLTDISDIVIQMTKDLRESEHVPTRNGMRR